ncbi:hypothetical protein AQPE_2657 [Aquipluma nitroreducens]|uniref:Uncharacterized protein n=1 Tax=Aquipluma nitroreducens TaxID=2010828 RepID=A0A5K7SAF9_9BACT|nr:hypothetical protein [Aquipluma nitroreducens]BBE18495.1 hypothetical protein AQPE_2657 [Aquipluma nitroreducens]
MKFEPLRRKWIIASIKLGEPAFKSSSSHPPRLKSQGYKYIVPMGP